MGPAPLFADRLVGMHWPDSAYALTPLARLAFRRSRGALRVTKMTPRSMGGYAGPEQDFTASLY
jgi:hypothetical protein